MNCSYFTGKCILKTIFIQNLLRLKLNLNKPGNDVPNATNDIAVTLSLRPQVHPKCDAKSPITAVNAPIEHIETTKQAQPPHISVGGTNANKSFQNREAKCIK
jgi:hypothetical protein